MNRTYADAGGAMVAWINSRTQTLAGVGKPLAKGAHLKHLAGNAPQAFARIEETVAARSDGAESPDMLASLSAQVYGGTKEAASDAAVALAEELSTELSGSAAEVELRGTTVRIWVADDIQGPIWAPDRDVPRYLLNFTVRLQPA